jgi:hypothetical protein
MQDVQRFLLVTFRTANGTLGDFGIEPTAPKTSAPPRDEDGRGEGRSGGEGEVHARRARDCRQAQARFRQG